MKNTHRSSTSRPAREPGRRFLLGSLLLLLLLGGSTPASAQGSGDKLSWTAHRDNGINYFKRKLYVPAIASLSQAAATPEGEKDFRTQLFLARAASQELVLEKAFPAAQRALEIAQEDKDEDNVEKAQQLVDELSSTYAGVTFRKDPDQKTELKETFIFLKTQEELINTQKKKVFGKISERFQKSKVKLPITLYLPFGKYKANGAPFEVKKGETAESPLFMSAEEPGGGAWYWYAGAAVLVAGGAATAAVLLLGAEETQQAARFEAMPVFGEQ